MNKRHQPPKANAKQGKKRFSLTTAADDKQIHRKRTFLVLAAFLFMVTLIGLRLIRIQFGNKSTIGIRETEGNGRQVAVEAPRGNIVDASGFPLAYSVKKTSLYLAYTGLEGRALNQYLLDLHKMLSRHNIEYKDGLTDYLDMSSQSKTKSLASQFPAGEADRGEGDPGDGPRFVFKKPLEEIALWEQKEDTFRMQAIGGQSPFKKEVILDPQDFYAYLLFDFFKIEDRTAGGSLYYTPEEAFAIMRLRYLILKNNWTFTQGTPIKLVDDCDPALSDLIDEHNKKYRGLLLLPSYQRKYDPATRDFCHINGYVGAISDQEYDRLKNSGYEMHDLIGKAGIELQAEPYLHGKSGYVSYGSWVYDPSTKQDEYIEGTDQIPPQPGDTVQLTINRKLQRATVEALCENMDWQRKNRMGKTTSASAVMLDVRTGAVLAMASVPTYVPQDFLDAKEDPLAAERVSKYLTDGIRKPMLNRCISEIYSPGSTFKPITAAAAIMNGVIHPGDDVYVCRGHDVIGYKDWYCFEKPIEGHGPLTLKQGLVTSCNLYFFQMGIETGIDQIAQWAKNFGLGEWTNIDLPGEVRGVRPSRESKRASRPLPEDKEWFPADTCQTSIGQFDNAYTMLQLSKAIGAIATGKLVTPHVIKEITDAHGKVVRPEQISVRDSGLSKTAIEMIREGMRALKTDSDPSTHVYQNFKDYPIDISCKTGTAETGSGRILSTNSLFVCYAPTDAPEVVIACVVEGGGLGDVTSHIARDMLDSYYGLPRRPTAKKHAPLNEERVKDNPRLIEPLETNDPSFVPPARMTYKTLPTSTSYRSEEERSREEQSAKERSEEERPAEEAGERESSAEPSPRESGAEP